MKKKKEHKLYQTKNVLFYAEPTILIRLIQLIESHNKRYSADPKRIFITGEQWREYEIEVSGENPDLAYSYSVAGYPRITISNKKPFRGQRGVVALHFRGIPVVVDGQWKGLLYE